eukprot:Phypoly_transcript_10899.p1 GENE.Phypoly_transcript_10899~~Phypoly_transcript_10899.p1  ORF type:complete len:370 (+),score=13.82 Phypoly_transcript_10899:65-1174(+)
MGVDLLSTKWHSHAEMIHWKETVDPIIYGLNIGLCVVAQIIFYIFPRLRVFPRSILSWVNLYNLWYSIALVIKWSPKSVLHESWVLHLKAGTPICRAGILLDNAGLLGPICCTLLLILTMFLRIVLGVDIEGKRVYYWSYLAFAVAYPFVTASIAAFAFQQNEAFGVCIIGSPGDFPIRMTFIVVFFVQMILFTITMLYIKRALMRVRHTTTNAFPISYLAFRFGAMFFSQIIGLVPLQVAFLFQQPNVSGNAIMNRFVTVCRFVGCALDSLVLIFGNVDFMDWLKKRFKRDQAPRSVLAKRYSVTTEPASRSSGSPRNIEAGLSAHIEMEKMALSQSSEKMGISVPRHLSCTLAASTDSNEPLNEPEN